MDPTKFSELRNAVLAKPGAAARLIALRSATLEEIRVYELRRDEAPSLVESEAGVVKGHDA